jgi:hypothetical protein
MKKAGLLAVVVAGIMRVSNRTCGRSPCMGTGQYSSLDFPNRKAQVQQGRL